jgi:hypothetical protein
MESHDGCDGKQLLCAPSSKRLESLGKREKWLHDQNGGAEKSKIETKIRNSLDVLKMDRVKKLVIKNLENMTI